MGIQKGWMALSLSTLCLQDSKNCGTQKTKKNTKSHCINVIEEILQNILNCLCVCVRLFMAYYQRILPTSR